MYIGMPTLLELDSLQKNIDQCILLGLNFLEINMNIPDYNSNMLDLQFLLDVQKQHNIFFTFHIADDLDVFNLNPQISATNREIILETIHIAEKLKSPIVNMHLQKGICFTLPNQKVYLCDRYQTEYLRSIKDFLALIPRHLNHTHLCIENTGILHYDHILFAMRHLLCHSKIGLTWDIGHDCMSNWNDSPFITSNLSSIRHLHLHDATFTVDHLPFGEGNINIDKYLQLARQNNLSAVIEIKTSVGLKKSLDYFM